MLLLVDFRQLIACYSPTYSPKAVTWSAYKNVSKYLSFRWLDGVFISCLYNILRLFIKSIILISWPCLWCRRTGVVCLKHLTDCNSLRVTASAVQRLPNNWQKWRSFVNNVAVWIGRVAIWTVSLTCSRHTFIPGPGSAVWKGLIT